MLATNYSTHVRRGMEIYQKLTHNSDEIRFAGRQFTVTCLFCGVQLLRLSFPFIYLYACRMEEMLTLTLGNIQSRDHFRIFSQFYLNFLYVFIKTIFGRTHKKEWEVSQQSCGSVGKLGENGKCSNEPLVQTNL